MVNTGPYFWLNCKQKSSTDRKDKGGITACIALPELQAALGQLTWQKLQAHPPGASSRSGVGGCNWARRTLPQRDAPSATQIPLPYLKGLDRGHCTLLRLQVGQGKGNDT